MNNTAKISLSIYRQGSALIRESKVEEINWKITRGDVLPKIPNLSERDKDIVVRHGVALHHNRVSSQVMQLVTLTKDAYDEFTGACPSWADPRDWRKMSKTGKINAHCQVIAEEVGSQEYDFTILED